MIRNLNEDVDSRKIEDSVQRKLFTSKLKSLNDQISNLLQKKIRIDLEIKRTKKKISKLKSNSLTYIKSSVQLEGFNYDSLDNENEALNFINEVGQETYQELWNLDEQIFRAEKLLSELESVPLFEES